MSKILRGIGIFIAVFVWLGICWWAIFSQRETDLSSTEPNYAAGQARDFTLSDRNGQNTKLSDLKGKTVLLHFWASWCPPCIDEIGDLVKFAAKVKVENLVFVVLSLDPNWEEAEKIMSQKDLPKNLISLIDPTTKVADLYGSYKYPETYLIDATGAIREKWVGPQNWDHSQILDKVTQIAKKI